LATAPREEECLKHIGTLLDADKRTRDAVLQALEWDSQLDASAIGVIANGRVVTLTGFVDSYAAKLAAERTAKRMHGVRAVANDIQVRLRLERTDSEIAADAARALDLRVNLPDTVQAMVHNGHLTLTGTVATLFHRAVAEKAVRHIHGLKGVFNRIKVAPTATARDVRKEIVRALHREAATTGLGINVIAANGKVTLTGNVVSWHEREAAERAAMHAPGITEVDNRIVVAWLDTEAHEYDETD
jgi:osmotically-inducible protein OsmY